MPDYRKQKRLRIVRTPSDKYQLILEEGKARSYRIIGGDMDSKAEAERRKDAYSKTYGLR